MVYDKVLLINLLNRIESEWNKKISGCREKKGFFLTRSRQNTRMVYQYGFILSCASLDLSQGEGKMPETTS
jgi:hypothetical protein